MTTSTRPYHHGQVRDVTLATARTMLETRPARDLSLREIARAAGLSHAAPYKHFPERRDFLAALAARCLHELVEAQRVAMAGARSPRRRLLALGQAYVQYGIDHPHAFELIFDPTLDRSPDDVAAATTATSAASAASLSQLIDDHAALLHEAVAAAIADGTVTAAINPGVTGQRLWAEVHGLAVLAIGGFVDAGAVGDILASGLAAPARVSTAGVR